MDFGKIGKEFAETYQKALVTGGAGFIGSHIIEELLTLGVDVVCLDNFVAGKQSNIQPFMQNKHFSLVDCDITDYKSLEPHVKDVDIIFNEAASKKNVCINNPRRDLHVNGEGTFNLLELARDYGVKKFVHASTGSVYGEAQIIPQTETHPLNPVSYYGVSKLAGERYVKTFSYLYDLNTTILRYFHVYGSRQESGIYGGVIAIFIRQLLEGKNLTIFGDGTQERSFTYVKDVARANILVAVCPETKGEVYNCASGLNVTLNELSDLLLTIMGKKGVLDPVYSDWTIGDIKKFSISNSKLCSLGFSFEYPFLEGLKETIRYFSDAYCKGLI